jgi:hypothetical protein
LLGLIFPLQLFQRRTRDWNSACGKWIAILRWGLGLEGWVRQYDARQACTSSAIARGKH